MGANRTRKWIQKLKRAKNIRIARDASQDIGAVVSLVVRVIRCLDRILVCALRMVKTLGLAVDAHDDSSPLLFYGMSRAESLSDMSYDCRSSQLALLVAMW
jgi:hypothetical protein